MFLTSYKETKDIMSKNLLKIAIAGVLTFFMVRMEVVILLPIIGYWILKSDFKFNLKTVIIIGLCYLMVCLPYEVYSDTINSYKIENYLSSVRNILVIALIIDCFIKKEVAPNIIILIYFIVFNFIFDKLEETYYKGNLCNYSFIILAYFLFFTVQEKKLKECLSIKGLLTVVWTFIVFYLINFYGKKFYKFFWEISKMTNSWLVLIFLICGGYYLKVFYYIFVFNLIKNLKRNSNERKGEKDDFIIE